MNINLHVERLILDGMPLAAADRARLQAAVEAELTRLLATAGLGESLRAGGSFYKLRTAGIQLPNDGDPAGLGEQIAGAVYGGLGNEP